jgi:hypothetical protein
MGMRSMREGAHQPPDAAAAAIYCGKASSSSPKEVRRAMLGKAAPVLETDTRPGRFGMLGFHKYIRAPAVGVDTPSTSCPVGKGE